MVKFFEKNYCYFFNIKNLFVYLHHEINQIELMD